MEVRLAVLVKTNSRADKIVLDHLFYCFIADRFLKNFGDSRIFDLFANTLKSIRGKCDNFYFPAGFYRFLSGKVSCVLKQVLLGG
jgi:hypothetical protein